jgi:hypothetical protein
VQVLKGRLMGDALCRRKRGLAQTMMNLLIRKQLEYEDEDARRCRRTVLGTRRVGAATQSRARRRDLA